MPEVEGWGEYRKLILAELERLSRSIGDVDRKIDQFGKDEIAKLRADLAETRLGLATLTTTVAIKSGVWGAVSGAIPATLAALIWWMSKK